MSRDLLSIEWKLRAEPLMPHSVAARDAAALRLAKRLLALEDEKLARFDGISAENFLLISGKSEDLPWVEGASYLGRDSLAPALLLSTVYEPSIPSALLERALVQQFKEQAPFAVLFNPNEIISISRALPVSRKILQNWLDQNSQIDLNQKR